MGNYFSILTISAIAYLSNQFIFKNIGKKQLEVAQENWLKQGVSHYRLTLHYVSPDRCQKELEIKDEKVIAVKKNTCKTLPPLTITELFQEIEPIAMVKNAGRMDVLVMER